MVVPLKYQFFLVKMSTLFLFGLVWALVTFAAGMVFPKHGIWVGIFVGAYSGYIVAKLIIRVWIKLAINCCGRDEILELRNARVSQGSSIDRLFELELGPRY